MLFRDDTVFAMLFFNILKTKEVEKTQTAKANSHSLNLFINPCKKNKVLNFSSRK